MLKQLVNKGVRLIVTEGDEAVEPSEPAPAREIPPEAYAAVEPRAVPRSEVAADVSDFGAVYDEAGIEMPAHGYGVNKVAEMLEGKRLGSLAREVKATAVLAALEAAQVDIRDVIQDAVLRDKALDAFEASKEREVHEVKAQNDTRIQSLKDQLEEVLRKINTEVEKLKQQSESAVQAFAALQVRKRREEQRLHDIVAHFVEGANPVTTGSLVSVTSPPPPPRSGKE
jgi:hypothetical protein